MDEKKREIVQDLLISTHVFVRAIIRMTTITNINKFCFKIVLVEQFFPKYTARAFEQRSVGESVNPVVVNSVKHLCTFYIFFQNLGHLFVT